jgi:hypothetical protein
MDFDGAHEVDDYFYDPSITFTARENVTPDAQFSTEVTRATGGYIDITGGTSGEYFAIVGGAVVSVATHAYTTTPPGY